jgi:hypothetical protein
MAMLKGAAIALVAASPGARFSSSTATNVTLELSLRDAFSWLTTISKSIEVGCDTRPTNTTGRRTATPLAGSGRCAPMLTLLVRYTMSGAGVLTAASGCSAGTSVSLVAATRQVLTATPPVCPAAGGASSSPTECSRVRASDHCCMCSTLASSCCMFVGVQRAPEAATPSLSVSGCAPFLLSALQFVLNATPGRLQETQPHVPALTVHVSVFCCAKNDAQVLNSSWLWTIMRTSVRLRVLPLPPAVRPSGHSGGCAPPGGDTENPTSTTRSTTSAVVPAGRRCVCVQKHLLEGWRAGVLCATSAAARSRAGTLTHTRVRTCVGAGRNHRVSAAACSMYEGRA